MRLSNIYKEVLIENVEDKMISITYLKNLLKNVSNKAGQKVLRGWINMGGDKVKLSPRQYQLLKDIQIGGPKPNMYGTKN